MDHDPVTNIESLGWNDLVLLKRKFSASIREVTQEIIDIDNNKLPRVNQEIHEQKIGLNGSVVKSRKIGWVFSQPILICLLSVKRSINQKISLA